MKIVDNAKNLFNQTVDTVNKEVEKHDRRKELEKDIENCMIMLDELDNSIFKEEYDELRKYAKDRIIKDLKELKSL